MSTEEQVEAFVTRWTASSASEESNSKPSMPELCDLLGVPRPDPQKQRAQHLRLRARREDPSGRRLAVVGQDRSLARGLLCLGRQARRHGQERQGQQEGHGDARDAAMERAREQAERYAKAMSPTHGWVPFLIVLDVGHSIELYADFSRAGHGYTAFPKADEHRFSMQDLRKQEVRELLRDVWLRPLELDPSRRAEKVTREVSAKLGQIARQLEQAQHNPEKVAAFLQRVL